MNDLSLPSRDLVLIGAGHTNLHVVRMWRMQPIPDVRLTVISPFSRATYSGMLPGTLAGFYQPDDMEIDLYRFSESCGARLIVDEVAGLEPAMRRVLFADRPPLRYDAASVGIGSVPGQREIWARNPQVLSIKPMATFRKRFAQKLSELPAAKRAEVVIVGAGAGGVEVAFGLDVWLRKSGIDAQISLIDANREILADYSPGTIGRARRELARRGISLSVGRRVSEITATSRAIVRFDDGSSITADLVIWATAAAAPPVLANFRLPKTDDGFLEVAPTL
ncbi:MAG TPA: FAD-dependent oxidoreductase, partial [Planctomycetaceae bacterium]|nr:FAD-dependent oxidoreductase [Planctomycetaceae bacterium]